MAQYWFDASQSGFADEFTQLQITGGKSAPTLSTVNGFPALNWGGNFNSTFLILNSIPDVSDTENWEVLVKCCINDDDATNNIGPAGLIQGSDNNASGYLSDRTYPKTIWNRRYKTNSLTSLGSISRLNAISNQMLEWIWMRLRHEANPDGSTTLKLKCWVVGNAEPGAFQLINNDSAANKISGTGKLGIFIRDSSFSFLNSVSVGTNGDPAPTSPIGGTQFRTNFSEYTAGEAPHDWFKPTWGVSSSWTPIVRSEGFLPFTGTEGGQALEVPNPGSARAFFLWDLVPESSTFDIRMRVRPWSSGGNVPEQDIAFNIDSSTQSGDKMAVTFGGTSQFRYQTFINNTLALRDSVSITDNRAVWSWLRCRRNTSLGVVQFKIWTGLEEDEPTTWNLESDIIDTHNNLGSCGIFSYDGRFVVDSFSVGINGYPALTESGEPVDPPPPAGPSTPVNLSVIYSEPFAMRLTWEPGP